MLLGGDIPNTYLDIREEFDLHQYLSRLESLRASAAAEVDLRGPFPDSAYSNVLRRTGAMLDAFHAMNVMIMKNQRATKGEAEILRYTVSERAQLSTRISHLFQGNPILSDANFMAEQLAVLASSIKLEYPLNEALPNTDHARDRLLAKIFHFRKENQEDIGSGDEDFELLYAYGKPSEIFKSQEPSWKTNVNTALVTGQLANEITHVGKEIENLFGVLDEEMLELR